ncbi:MAG: DUF1015 domain-containing protein [Planctomycetes bacterium]|jgi:uncharacterized protein (DUF1015 family)|nr:DUF1015 domain-containing protein [Planctomycetota bacterium]
MEVKPFKALRFNAGVVGDVGSCIAPPYDVISDQERDGLCRKSKHNIVHITKGKTSPSDSAEHNQYTRAAEYLRTWITEGALKEDDRDTIYGYIQDFEINGTTFQRLSFIGLAKLEDFGPIVRPHEQVFEKPMLDRLNLERATAARFGLVFMLYEDPEGVADTIITRAATEKPLIDFVDDQGVRHRLYAITAEDDIEAVEVMMRDKSCIIADGHHRYTTGLKYMRESGNPKARYQMIAFTNTRQEGLVVLATHRLVGGIAGFNHAEFLARLGRSFRLTQFSSAENTPEQAKEQMLAEMRRLHNRDQTVFGVYAGDKSFHVAVLKKKALMTATAPDKSEAWRALDIAVLQKLVLEGLLGLDEEKMGNPQYIEYIKDVPNAMNAMIEQVEAGRKQIAFFTNPVKMQHLARITEAGERMPHKSTYFYPKMYTGLTIQKLK